MRVTRINTFVALLVAAILIAGCSETVLVRSGPSGAVVYLDGKPIGTTPLDYSLPRSEVGEPRPAGDLNDVGPPSHDAVHQRRIAQTEKAVRPGIGGDVGNPFEFVSLREGNVPGHPFAEAAIFYGVLGFIFGATWRK